MASSITRKPTREPRLTVLIVGEGLAEHCFLSHLKSLYLVRGAGRSVTLKAAKGKGGKGVLDYTLRQLKMAQFGQVAALLDTDVDWDDVQRKRARKAEVQVLESVPCLEALLLSLHGIGTSGDSTACKRRFEQEFAGTTLSAAVYARHFDLPFCEGARQRHAVLNELLRLLGG
jgi:hypothetical protein